MAGEVMARLDGQITQLARAALAPYKLDRAAQAQEVEMLVNQLRDAIASHLDSLGLEVK